MSAAKRVSTPQAFRIINKVCVGSFRLAPDLPSTYRAHPSNDTLPLSPRLSLFLRCLKSCLVWKTGLQTRKNGRKAFLNAATLFCSPNQPRRTPASHSSCERLSIQRYRYTFPALPSENRDPSSQAGAGSGKCRVLQLGSRVPQRTKGETNFVGTPWSGTG